MQCSSTAQEAEETLWPLHPHAQVSGMFPSEKQLHSGLGSSLKTTVLETLLSSDLQAPLESLELAFCSLVPADLTFLPQSFQALALKRLDLSRHDFSQGLLEPLRLLLEETSASLLHLDLMECCMADSHLDALLPPLRHCSHLCFLGVYGNPMSTATLKDLLQKTLELRDIHLVVYAFPWIAASRSHRRQNPPGILRNWWTKNFWRQPMLSFAKC
ncbi:leucine-rich repeat-containing protein 14-like [Melospiza georgiana]|uniref:leucine-rich repeat-containing protein 14-like n=1 Tax=Melospiza georgiana TaxID=44398 RepID=UPI0025AC0C4E|nr:leucine-rich repeat-containing protein 14-like [Melospiza georgiana]